MRGIIIYSTVLISGQKLDNKRRGYVGCWDPIESFQSRLKLKALQEFEEGKLVKNWLCEWELKKYWPEQVFSIFWKKNKSSRISYILQKVAQLFYWVTNLNTFFQIASILISDQQIAVQYQSLCRFRQPSVHLIF